MAHPAESQAIASPAADFNPVAWGQFHLRGGWKGFWPTTLGYAAVVGCLMLLVIRLSDGTPGALVGLKIAFTALQAGLIVIFTSTRVSTAIRQDQTSRMIESHRLTPMSPSQAVLGYLLGPVAQPMALCGVNVLLGLGLCRATGTPPVLWLTLNTVLLLFSLFAMVLSAFGAFSGRPAGAAVGWIASLIGMINFFSIGAVLPAVNVLATPVLGHTIFNLSFAGRDAVAIYAPSTVFQLLIAVVCFAGACRRYRRDDRPALGWDLGLALLAAWVATSAFGIVFWDAVEPSVARGRNTDPAGQFLGSVMSAMLLAVVPLAGSAWQSADWEGRRALGDRPAGRRPPPPPLVALAAVALTLALVLALASAGRDRGGAGAPPDAIARTAAVVLSFYLATSYLLRILVRVTAKLLYPLLIWLMLSCFVPMSIDYVRWWLDGGTPGETMLGAASAFGVPGALTQVWTADAQTTNAGIVFQAVLAAGMAAAYYATPPAWARKPVAPGD